MLVDDHLLYHPSWDQPDPMAGELHQPAPLCLRPTVNKRHHWVCVLCSVSYGGVSKTVKQVKAPRQADRMGQNDRDKSDNADSQAKKASNMSDDGDKKKDAESQLPTPQDVAEVLWSEDQDDNITKVDLDITFRYLNEDYDWEQKIRVSASRRASLSLGLVTLSTPARSR
ncbi:hypothetical protein NU219Hw_g4738t1 [Hortaea werneckii]